MNNALELQQTLLGQTGAGPRVDPGASVAVQFFQGHRIEIFATAACLALMVLVFELVRRHKIKEKYSFLWFITCASLLLLTAKRAWLTSLADAIGVYYPPTALFLVLSFFMILILVHFSMVITGLLTQNQKLAQKLALLEAELTEIKEFKDSDGDHRRSA